MDLDTLIIWGVGLALAFAAIVPFLRRHRRLERAAEEGERVAARYGLDEPATLHPVVDPASCIGTGNCVEICPEKDVLGLRGGQARPVSPARCVGHGLCERSCPMEAIQLVFGTEKRGVDLPRVQANFETNVPGLYVVGELGGMGLIRNAFEQGRQCIEGIAREDRPTPEGALDLLVVGCGPAGLSASLSSLHHGLRFKTIEKEDVGGAVRSYPRKKLVMTGPVPVPGYGKLRFREIQKEELMDLWRDIIEQTGLEVQTEETVLSVDRTDASCFTVTTTKGRYTTRRVVLAIGRRGVPRKLGVPGEALPKVAYALREPEAYRGDRIVVVGGGDSAVEAALALSDQPGSAVALSYRRDRLSRIKPANLERFEGAVDAGRLEALWETEVEAIEPAAVHLRRRDGATLARPNDSVFVFIGGELPTAFLEACGIRIDTKFGEP